MPNPLHPFTTNQKYIITSYKLHPTPPKHHMPSHYLLEAFPTEAKFHSMDNTKAIKSIYMVLPISKEEIKQAKHNLQNPHTWHNVAKSIINNINKSSYIDDIDIDDEEINVSPIHHKTN
jgi:hypothetical protein